MRLILLGLILLSLGIGLACNNAAKPTIVKKETTPSGKTEPATTPETIADSVKPTNKKVDSHGHIDEAPRITLEEAKKDFDAGRAVFVDTRDITAFQTLRIKGAINISAQSVETRWREIPTGKKVIAYCS